MLRSVVGERMRTHARKSKLCEADGRKTKAGRTFCGLPRLRYSVARCTPYKSSHPDHAKAQRKLCFLLVWGEKRMTRCYAPSWEKECAHTPESRNSARLTDGKQKRDAPSAGSPVCAIPSRVALLTNLLTQTTPKHSASCAFCLFGVSLHCGAMLCSPV